MGYRCRWGIIGRNDHEEIKPMPEDTVRAIAGLHLSLAEGMKTIYDVHNDIEFIGQVRTTFSGQFFRQNRAEEFVYVAFRWNENDPQHGAALAALIGCRGGV